MFQSRVGLSPTLSSILKQPQKPKRSEAELNVEEFSFDFEANVAGFVKLY
jgi:hypothetical protein